MGARSRVQHAGGSCRFVHLGLGPAVDECWLFRVAMRRRMAIHSSDAATLTSASCVRVRVCVCVHARTDGHATDGSLGCRDATLVGECYRTYVPMHAAQPPSGLPRSLSDLQDTQTSVSRAPVRISRSRHSQTGCCWNSNFRTCIFRLSPSDRVQTCTARSECAAFAKIRSGRGQ